MSSRKKRRGVARDERRSLIKGSVYVVSDVEPFKGSPSRAEVSASKKAISDGARMAEIEAYAKRHKVSITQAMVHFMESDGKAG